MKNYLVNSRNRINVVLISSNDDYFSGGGVSLFNSAIALNLVYNVEVKLTKKYTLYNALEYAGIKVSVIREYGKLDLIYGFRVLLSVLKFKKNELIVVTHSERTSFLVNPILFLLRFKLATVLHRSITSGSPWIGKIKSFIFAFLENFILKNFTNIVYCVSANLACELITKRRVNKNKVFLLSNYVDLNTIELRCKYICSISEINRKENHPSADHYNITSIIRDNHVKGADFFNSRAFQILITHIQSVTNKKIYLYLVGHCANDNYYQDCGDICNNLGISLIVTGVINNVDEFLGLTDLYIQPSRDEAFGLGAIEATFYECIVLTSNIAIFSKTLVNYSMFFPVISYSDDWHVDLCQLSAPVIMGRRNGQVMEATYNGWIEYNFSSSAHLEQFNSPFVDGA